MATKSAQSAMTRALLILLLVAAALAAAMPRCSGQQIDEFTPIATTSGTEQRFESVTLSSTNGLAYLTGFEYTTGSQGQTAVGLLWSTPLTGADVGQLTLLATISGPYGHSVLLAGSALTADGSSVYVTGSSGSLAASLWSISLAEATLGVVTEVTSIYSYSFSNLALSADGSTAYIAGYDSNDYALIIVTLTGTSASSYSSFEMGGQAASLSGVALSPDGTVAYVSGQTPDGNGALWSIPLTGASAGTPSVVSQWAQSSWSTSWTDVTVTSDGTQAYVIGRVSDSSYFYDLLWSVSLSGPSAGSNNPFSYYGNEITMWALALSANGDDVYVVGDDYLSGGGDLYQVVLAVPSSSSSSSSSALPPPPSSTGKAKKAAGSRHSTSSRLPATAHVTAARRHHSSSSSAPPRVTASHRETSAHEPASRHTSSFRKLHSSTSSKRGK